MPKAIDLSVVAATVCKQRNFTLVRDLGVGAFKCAYLIEHNGKRYALKVAPISPSLLPRFEREAAALNGCSHPAIAVLHESSLFKDGSDEYWVSVEEYLSGGTLSDRCSRGALDPLVVRQIGASLGDALEHLRVRSLVHRDIKPANILFRSGDEAVLTDFGIVRMLEAPTLTKEYLPQGPGTPLYAAPEQLRNEMHLINWRTDQFDLALVLAECVLEFHPFGPEGDENLAVARLARRDPLPARSRDLLIERGFESLIKAMMPWPIQRYQYPADFVVALARN